MVPLFVTYSYYNNHHKNAQMIFVFMEHHELIMVIINIIYSN
jgi:hypothetical protein